MRPEIVLKKCTDNTCTLSTYTTHIQERSSLATAATLLAVFQNNGRYMRLFAKKLPDSCVDVANVADARLNGSDTLQNFHLPETQATCVQQRQQTAWRSSVIGHRIHIKFPLPCLEKISGPAKHFFQDALHCRCTTEPICMRRHPRPTHLTKYTVHKDAIPRCITYGTTNISKFIATLFQQVRA